MNAQEIIDNSLFDAAVALMDDDIREALHFENGALNDEFVLATIDQARRAYEDGAIIEARDTLLNVINAIDDFDREYYI